MHILEPRELGRNANDFLRKIWAPKPYIADGGYNRDDAIALTDKNANELVAFGRHYTSNVSMASGSLSLRSLMRA
jgi:NADPH2 dehydrogenase